MQMLSWCDLFLLSHPAGSRHVSVVWKTQQLSQDSQYTRPCEGCGTHPVRLRLFASSFWHRSIETRTFLGKRNRQSAFSMSWIDDFFQKDVLDLCFFKLSDLWLRPKGCRVCRLGLLARKLRATLRNIYLFRVAVLYALKLADRVQKLLLVLRVLVRQVDLALQTKFELLIIFAIMSLWRNIWVFLSRNSLCCNVSTNSESSFSRVA